MTHDAIARYLGTPTLAERIGAASASATFYTQHVEPVIAWSIREYGDASRARYAIDYMRHHDAISDTAHDVLRQAATALGAR